VSGDPPPTDTAEMHDFAAFIPKIHQGPVSGEPNQSISGYFVWVPSVLICLLVAIGDEGRFSSALREFQTLKALLHIANDSRKFSAIPDLFHPPILAC